MKKLIAFLLVLCLCVATASTVFAKADLPRLVDNADLLSNGEESRVLAALDEISERQEVDIVVVTTDSLDGKSPMAYADDFLDYNGYGFGANHDGILLLVSMEDRDWWISTTGFGITAITDAGLEYISDQFLFDLSNEYYEDAFMTYAELCDEFITQARTGEPYDASNLPKEPFGFFSNLLFALVFGFVVAFIVTAVMKGQLKSVRYQSAASNYVKNGSLNVTESRDLFLYRQVSRRAKPKNNGSSTHRSSSGRSHGGGGGKF